jgi:hypothetical protein
MGEVAVVVGDQHDPLEPERLLEPGEGRHRILVKQRGGEGRAAIRIRHDVFPFVDG